MEQPLSPYQTPLTQEPSIFVKEDPRERGVKYVLFSFDGRIPRRTFWLWSIVTMVVWIGVLGGVVALGEQGGLGEAAAWILGVPGGILAIWTGLAIRVKRWHDHDKSWVWILIGIIPYIGELIAFIYLGCLRGTDGPNRYGSDPT